jgi:hypothetical protein
MFSTLDEKLLANYLTKKIKENNLTIEFVAKESNTPVSTVKNLCSGKTANPGLLTSLPVIYASGGTPEEMIGGENQDAVKEFSINSIKEMCEQAIAELTRTNEIHVTNIRNHYEQHRDDVTTNYEKRLEDKNEIIKEKDKQINFFKIIAAIGYTILIGLLIAEVMNPNLGWIQF